jgi:hypothetical protein
VVIPNVDPDDGDSAGLQNVCFSLNFGKADHPRRFYCTYRESYKSCIVQDYKTIYVNPFDSATNLQLATVFIFALMAQ